MLEKLQTLEQQALSALEAVATPADLQAWGSRLSARKAN